MHRIVRGSTLLALSLVLGAALGCEDEPAEHVPAEAGPAAEAPPSPPAPEASASDPADPTPNADEPSASPEADAAASDGQLPGLTTGAEAPSFTLTDQHGDQQSLTELLKKGPVALVFYRSADW